MERTWVVVRGEGALYILDPHAADERVQLERLTRDALCAQTGLPRRGAAGGAVVGARRLRPPRSLSLSAHEAALLRAHEPRLRAWGWEAAAEPSEVALGVALLRAVPLLLGEELGGPALIECAPTRSPDATTTRPPLPPPPNFPSITPSPSPPHVSHVPPAPCSPGIYTRSTRRRAARPSPRPACCACSRAKLAAALSCLARASTSTTGACTPLHTPARTASAAPAASRHARHAFACLAANVSSGSSRGANSPSSAPTADRRWRRSCASARCRHL
jgi:hypothetical protein